MKEMLHSKILMGFIVFVLSFTYLNTSLTDTKNIVLEEDNKIENELVLR